MDSWVVQSKFFPFLPFCTHTESVLVVTLSTLRIVTVGTKVLHLRNVLGRGPCTCVLLLPSRPSRCRPPNPLLCTSFLMHTHVTGHGAFRFSAHFLASRAVFCMQTSSAPPPCHGPTLLTAHHCCSGACAGSPQGPPRNTTWVLGTEPSLLRAASFFRGHLVILELGSPPAAHLGCWHTFPETYFHFEIIFMKEKAKQPTHNQKAI